MGAGTAFESVVRGYEPRELPHTLPGIKWWAKLDLHQQRPALQAGALLWSY
jgi:hypothetical protein